MINRNVSNYGKRRLNVAKRLCCSYWNIDEDIVFTKTRDRGIMNAKHSIRYLLTTDNNLSLAEIGGLTNCDHSNVIHSRDKFLELCDVDADFRVLLSKMKGVKVLQAESDLMSQIDKILSRNTTKDIMCNSLYKMMLVNNIDL